MECIEIVFGRLITGSDGNTYFVVGIRPQDVWLVKTEYLDENYNHVRNSADDKKFLATDRNEGRAAAKAFASRLRLRWDDAKSD